MSTAASETFNIYAANSLESLFILKNHALIILIIPSSQSLQPPSVSLLLGRVALVAQRPRQTFPWTICRSVGPYVRLCVGLSNALWKTADRIRMPFGIIGRTGP